jgi:hypothetical protein
MNIRSILSAASCSFVVALTGCVVHEYSGGGGGGEHHQRETPQHVAGANYMIHTSLNQGLCLDVSQDRAVAGQPVALFGCHGRANQRFTFADRGGNASSIEGIGGLCLDVRGAGTADGTPVQIYPCGAQTNQSFRYFADGRIHEVQTGKCLTVTTASPGTQLVLDRCNESNAGQVWALTQ